MNHYEDRLARALATVINLLDPDVIVLAGGMSNVQRLYRNVPQRWGRYVFSDHVANKLLPPVHGDSTGVRGAAWLGRAPRGAVTCGSTGHAGLAIPISVDAAPQPLLRDLAR